MSSVLIVTVNKLVLERFHYPIFLTWIHQIAGWLLSSLYLNSHGQGVPDMPAFSQLTLAVAYSASLLLLNVSLLVNDIASYQLLKVLTTPAVAILQFLWLGKTVPPNCIIALAMATIGVPLATMNSGFNIGFGFVLGLVASVVAAASQILIQKFPALNGIILIGVVSPASSLLLGFAAVVELFVVWSPAQNPNLTLGTAGLVILSCILAIFTNYFSFSVISMTSALTFQFVGHLKTLVVILIGMLVFPANSSLQSIRGVFGITITAASLVLYSVARSDIKTTGGLVRLWWSTTGSKNIMARRPELIAFSLIIMTMIMAPMASFLIPTPIDGNIDRASEVNLVNVLRMAITEPSDSNFFEWTNPAVVKERICIVHADSRDVEIEKPDGSSYTVISRYYMSWWAIRHGYDYRDLRVQRMNDLYGTWDKLQGILETIPKYDVTIFFDSDAYVTDLDTTAEYMMERWGFSHNSSIMMAFDPPNEVPDNFNNTNTGFIVIRNTPLSIKIFQDLITCPDKIPGCSYWRHRWPHEQKAFSKYLRPNLTEGSEFIIAPCDEANGHPANAYCIWDRPRPLAPCATLLNTPIENNPAPTSQLMHSAVPPTSAAPTPSSSCTSVRYFGEVYYPGQTNHLGWLRTCDGWTCASPSCFVTKGFYTSWTVIITSVFVDAKVCADPSINYFGSCYALGSVNNLCWTSNSEGWVCPSPSCAVPTGQVRQHQRLSVF
ncbi:hypothetical protein SmJEL517_g06269 [Synchytrium microbalum]|uniref:Sugar phosphate transporter domain-containing protein n=1 Tax=Synchytrium microbalum TaxID=1806994 RepID=A0A507BW41_9FUNG|nr:uncharacterized protein SmJEL517_g06269 [Synchytrium microbalum]TPX30074.1 hypothetical protein SmJEL517_g06269 [Synchytrium microbalum]